MNLLHFRKIGGYREELFHQGEEMDLAARAFQHGFNCYHFPGFQIHHTASNQGRSWYRMDYFGSRNNLLWNDWYVPARAKLVQQVRTISARTFLACRVRRLAPIKGIYAGFVAMARFRSYRKPFSMELYNLWKQLPC
jgi:GT2 family glycosyltransferase